MINAGFKIFFQSTLTKRSLFFLLFLFFVAISTKSQVPFFVKNYTFGGTALIYQNGQWVPLPNAPVLVQVKSVFKKSSPPYSYIVKITSAVVTSDGAGHFETTAPCYIDLSGSWVSNLDGFAKPVGSTGTGSSFSGSSSNCNRPDNFYTNIMVARFHTAVTAELQNNGYFCKSVGKPINTTNGNMWLEQTDYVLPGIGENINIHRFYNSFDQESGLFGLGWKSVYDESISNSNNQYLTLKSGDGRVVYFADVGNNQFDSASPEFYGQVVKNTDNTYTLTFKDGRVHQFSTAGKLLWQKDRNGNQTTLSYDTNNRLTSITDAFGRTLTLTTNVNGTVSQISDSIATIATYEYYPSTTKLKTVTYNDGAKYKFEYTNITIGGQTKTFLTIVKDALDNILETHQYDAQGRATTSEKHGNVEKYTLDYTNANASTNPHTIVTDALGRVTKYYFDKSKGRNVVTKTEGICNCGGGSETTLYEYDAKLNLTKKVDALNQQTLYTYDGNGNRLTQTDTLGTETYTYNNFGQILTKTDRMNGVWTNTYDTSGNLLTAKDALNNTTTLAYSTIGQLAIVKDALNRTTTLTYDTSGRLTEVKDANNKTTNYAYDARARVTGITNALNETTAFEYDLNNRLKKVIYADTTFMTYTYDLAGRRTAMTDERGNTTNYGYDNAYRLTSVTDALNHTTTYSYDLMSNPTAQTDALGNTTNYEYDDFNRLKKVIYPPSQTGTTRLEERLEYDTLGNIKKRIDMANRETLYDYDTGHRLIKITDALNQLTQFEYNARSQMTKVKDALNQEYIFTYDALGRQLSQTRAGSVMNYEYDAVGNRTKRTDYTGRETTYVYDTLNRLTNINYTGQTGANAVYAYDDLSRLTAASNNAGMVNFTYDTRGRVKTSTDVFNHLVEYSYDAASNRTQLKLDSAVHTTYNYDNVNRLIQLSDEVSQSFTFGYDIANRLTSKTLPNGITTSYEYDGMSRLTRLKDDLPTANLFDRQYKYNPANQISQIAEPTQIRNFGYDNVDRLTSMTNGTSNEDYSFDGVGNRTASHLSAIYSYQPFNRMTSTSSSTMGYDVNGNLTSKTQGSTLWLFDWDYENRMISATNGTETASYKYDALGRRVERTKGSENTKFIYDGLDVIADDNSGTLTKYQNGLGIDNKLKISLNGTARYFLSDHLGSTNALTDSSGAIVESANYDSFGIATGNLTTRYQFTGREYDNFTGLYYYRARFYDAKLGRFISEDPIGFAGGDVNLYGYVLNNPIRFTDPLGTSVPIWDHSWYWYYSKKCAETGIQAACDVNNQNQTQEDLERMAQEAFNRGTGSVSGLRFKVGYAENYYCRMMEYYAGQIYTDSFQTNVQRVDPNGSVSQTAENVAKTQPVSKANRAWEWLKSLVR
jgi:RHS repeat-associated protein